MANPKLERILLDARPALEEGLAEAEAELAALDRRRDELVALIARAKAALGMANAPTPNGLDSARDMTLHEAMARVLRDNDNAWMTAREILDQVKARRLYRNRDGSPLELNQIHARATNYERVFEKAGSRIRLRQDAGVNGTRPR